MFQHVGKDHNIKMIYGKGAVLQYIAHNIVYVLTAVFFASNCNIPEAQINPKDGGKAAALRATRPKTKTSSHSAGTRASSQATIIFRCPLIFFLGTLYSLPANEVSSFISISATRSSEKSSTTNFRA
jgi:hypothetical protein